MIARRGNVRLIQSDNSSNFLGAENELKRAFLELDKKKSANFFKTKVLIGLNGCWCLGTKNSICKINSRITLKTHNQSFNDESFCTLMAEVEGIMNSRPLTVETLSDVTSYNLLSPSGLLTMKSKVVIPPAGKFQKEDLYTRKYWRRVQHLANEFWC